MIAGGVTINTELFNDGLLVKREQMLVVLNSSLSSLSRPRDTVTVEQAEKLHSTKPVYPRWDNKSWLFGVAPLALKEGKLQRGTKSSLCSPIAPCQLRVETGRGGSRPPSAPPRRSSHNQPRADPSCALRHAPVCWSCRRLGELVLILNFWSPRRQP